MILKPDLSTKRGDLGTLSTSLARYIVRTDDPAWDALEESFAKTYAELNASGTVKVSQSNIAETLSKAYRGILWADFSIDLVAASLRQRVFVNRIMHECEGIDSSAELSRAISRYSKFLHLMKKKDTISGKYIPLVPTLDIDLAWHTHQLYPRSYRDWCLQHIGRPINHDDTFGKETVRDGLRSTSLAWLDTYGEPYTTNHLRKAYFTLSRKCVGIMFPPYGLVMLNVGRKLSQAQISTHISQGLLTC